MLPLPAKPMRYIPAPDTFVAQLKTAKVHTLYLMCPRITVQSFQVHPKDEYFINMPTENYEQMKIIFSKPRVENPLTVNTL